MTSWAHVVTDPLGLAGFAIFLVFSYIGAKRQKKAPGWLAPCAYAMAAIALLGGIGLAYYESRPLASASPSQQIRDISQEASGSSASNIAGVQGNVSVTIGQASGRSPTSPLTVEELEHLVAAKVSSEVLIAEIERRGVASHITPELSQKLKIGGVPDSVIKTLSQKTAH